MNSMKDKVIVILGASSGIGEATVKLLASKRAKLVIASRREEKLKALADTLTESDIAYKAADVTDFDQVKAVIDMAMELHGRVDVLYNNAGIMPTAPLIEGRRNEWRQLLDITYTKIPPCTAVQNSRFGRLWKACARNTGWTTSSLPSFRRAMWLPTFISPSGVKAPGRQNWISEKPLTR